MRRSAFLLLGACASLGGVQASAQTAPSPEQRITIAAQGNPAGRPVALTVPVRDGVTYLGDIVVAIDAAGTVDFSAQRLIDLLSGVVDPTVLRKMRASFGGRTRLAASDFEGSGIALRYNSQELAIDLAIASERRATRTLQVAPIDGTRVGGLVAPAIWSGYLNVRGNLDYLYQGSGAGLQSPTMYIDGATRLLGTVIQSEAVWQPGAHGAGFQRLGSRLVHDDRGRLARLTIGDLETTARGFQSAPDIAGVSLFRSYSLLQPQRVSRPRGDRTFRLLRPSTVEVKVNGQIVRRMQLQPGSYDLRDFPFVQGANEVRLAILDDTGRSEMVHFNVFLDQSQLGAGLTEFGAYAGVLAPPGSHGPKYSGDLAATGYVRHGFSDHLTAGANFQADGRAQMGGVEGVLATSFGTIGGSFSASRIQGWGLGLASLVTFQRLIRRRGGRADSLNLSFEARSRSFGALGEAAPDNRFAWEVGGGYSHAFGDSLYGALDGRYSRGRGTLDDIANIRATMGRRLSDRLTLTSDARWRQDVRGRSLSGLFTLTVQVGRHANLRAEYDSRLDHSRLSYTLFRGQGVGAYDIAADIDRGDLGSGVAVTGSYFANRGEIGVSHFGSFADTFVGSTSQRTSLRIASSIAFADGAVSVGRPIYDSFAIVRGHRSLQGAPIAVEPTRFGSVATTGAFGTAVDPGLSSYAERTLFIDAPTAPAGTDIGSGAFKLFPAYRSGYLLTVGSRYNISAIGRLIDRDGAPVALVTGTATELVTHPREPVAVFTNRDGRFGLSGLAPGRWRIDMLDAARTCFMLDVPARASGVLRVGDLHPLDSPGSTR